MSDRSIDEIVYDLIDWFVKHDPERTEQVTAILELLQTVAYREMAKR